MEKRHFLPHEGVNRVIVAVATEDRDVVVRAGKPYSTTNPHVQIALDEHPLVKQISAREAAKLERAKTEATDAPKGASGGESGT